MGASKPRKDGVNPFKALRDDALEDVESMRRRIRKIKSDGVKNPDGYNAGFVGELEQRLAVMQAELEILRAQVKAFKAPAPTPHQCLPASWGV